MEHIKLFDSAEQALPVVIKLTNLGAQFSFEQTESGKFAVKASDSVRSILNEPCPSGFIIVQEGGSSTELYVHAHPTRNDAQDDRESCANSSYRTSPIVEVSPALVALGTAFYSALDEVVGSTVDIDYVEVSPDIETIASDIRYGFLVSLGYLVDRVSGEEGKWTWITGKESSGTKFDSAAEAIDGALQHAVEKTKAVTAMSDDEWNHLSEQEQDEAIIAAITGKTRQSTKFMVPDEA